MKVKAVNVVARIEDLVASFSELVNDNVFGPKTLVLSMSSVQDDRSSNWRGQDKTIV